MIFALEDVQRGIVRLSSRLIVLLFFPTMVHADVVIGLAGTLRVSFNASRIVIATQFAILRLCCRCHMAYQTMASHHHQGDKASHDHCTPCVIPRSHHTRRADCMRALARSSRCALQQNCRCVAHVSRDLLIRKFCARSQK